MEIGKRDVEIITTEEKYENKIEITEVRYHPLLGELPKRSINIMSLLAEKLQVPVTVNFNNVDITVKPGDKTDEILSDYHHRRHSTPK